MSRKKAILITSSLTFMVIASIGLIFTNKSSNLVSGQEHGASCQWNHYEAVDATNISVRPSITLNIA